jgi:hypothetical protein
MTPNSKIISIPAIVAATFFSMDGYAQTDNLVIGTWELVSSDNIIDGKTTPLYGEHPKGLIVYTQDHFVYFIAKPDLPKFASNKRTEGTAEENKAVAQGSIAAYGTYEINPDKKSLTQKIESASFPNWAGTTQQRIFTVSQDELRTTTPLASTGKGRSEQVWKRVK